MSYSQQEEEVLDALRDLGPSTGLALRAHLEWSTARLHPILAVLEEKEALRKWTHASYPYNTYYEVIKCVPSR